MEFLNPNLPEDVKEFLLHSRRRQRVRVLEYHPDCRFEDDPEFSEYDMDIDTAGDYCIRGRGSAHLIGVVRYTHYTRQ